MLPKGYFLVFLREKLFVKRLLIFIILLISNSALFAQDGIGPEGDKLIWILLILIIIIVVLFIFRKKSSHPKSSGKPLFQQKRVSVELEKDMLYYPDKLKLAIKNMGNSDIDLDKPLLIFDNFWLNRKFKLKGVGNRTFYPLYLEKGKTHTLQIDLTRFYIHDKSLKKFPKAKVIVYDIKGKRLGSKSVFLRKTLFRF